jgi:hypothetical protein
MYGQRSCHSSHVISIFSVIENKTIRHYWILGGLWRSKWAAVDGTGGILTEPEHQGFNRYRRLAEDLGFKINGSEVLWSRRGKSVIPGVLTIGLPIVNTRDRSHIRFTTNEAVSGLSAEYKDPPPGRAEPDDYARIAAYRRVLPSFRRLYSLVSPRTPALVFDIEAQWSRLPQGTRLKKLVSHLQKSCLEFLGQRSFASSRRLKAHSIPS